MWAESEPRWGRYKAREFRPAGGRAPREGGPATDRLPQEAPRSQLAFSNVPQGPRQATGRVKSHEVLTWVVPSEGHHFASWRKPIALDEVGRNGPLRREGKHALLRQTPPARHNCPHLGPQEGHRPGWGLQSHHTWDVPPVHKTPGAQHRAATTHVRSSHCLEAHLVLRFKATRTDQFRLWTCFVSSKLWM